MGELHYFVCESIVFPTDTRKMELLSKYTVVAPDNRVSAQSIGYVGIVILTIVGGLLPLMT
jgi:hypothetical protein